MTYQNPMTPDALRWLTRIGALSDSIAQDEAERAQSVIYARAEGASWRMIGTACGTTTQAAWERYRTPDPEHLIPEQDWLFTSEDDDALAAGATAITDAIAELPPDHE